MIPLKGVPEWTLLQEHAGNMVCKEKKPIIVYEMPDATDRMFFLLGLAAKAIIRKESRHILLMIDSSANIDAWHGRLFEMTKHCSHVTKRYSKVQSRYTCCSIVHFEFHPWVSPNSIILVDWSDSERIYSHLSLYTHNGAHRSAKFVIVHSCKGVNAWATLFPNVVSFPMDYPNATRRAIHAWIMCAQRMRFNRNVALLIAKYVEATRTEVCWLNLEYKF